MAREKRGAARNPSIDYKAPFEHVMRSLDPDDTLSVNDQEIIDGENSKATFQSPPGNN